MLIKTEQDSLLLGSATILSVVAVCPQVPFLYLDRYSVHIRPVDQPPPPPHQRKESAQIQQGNQDVHSPFAEKEGDL